MAEELIQIADTLIAHDFYPHLSQIPREIERVVVVPKKTRVILKGDTLEQANPNVVFELMGDEDFIRSNKRNNHFLGIENPLTSQSRKQSRSWGNLIGLLKQTEKIFGWDIEPSVWFAVGQPILGIRSFIRKKIFLSRHLETLNLL